jgi:hypothetical protein
VGPIYVSAAHHTVLPARTLRREPRQRFVEYEADLHRAAGRTLDPASLTRGDQYTYAELADTLVDRIGPAPLAALDALVTSYWTPEFDPDVSAFGPYLHHRYALDCESFDVVDLGSLAPVLALQILLGSLRADPATTSAALIAVEQNTVPQEIGGHIPGPDRSAAGLLRLTKDPRDDRFELVAAATFGPAEVLEPDFDIDALAGSWRKEYEIPRERLTVRVRRNTFLYRKWAYLHSDETRPYRLRYRPPENSGLDVFRWLSTEIAKPKDGRYVMFVEEDVVSLAAAAILLRVGAP